MGQEITEDRGTQPEEDEQNAGWRLGRQASSDEFPPHPHVLGTWARQRVGPKAGPRPPGLVATDAVET